jgi:hypothetical protein
LTTPQPRGSEYYYLENGLLIGVARLAPGAVVPDPAAALKMLASRWGNVVCLWPDPVEGLYLFLYVKFHRQIKRFASETKALECLHSPPPGNKGSAAPQTDGFVMQMERINVSEDGENRVFVGYCPVCATVWWSSDAALADWQLAGYIDKLCEQADAEKLDD